MDKVVKNMKPILNKIMLVCIFFVLCFSFVSNVKSFRMLKVLVLLKKQVYV